MASYYRCASPSELIVYGPNVKEIARHLLYPSGVTGEEHRLPQHAPARDQQQKRELLRQRFAEFGAEGVLFFDGLLAGRRNGKDEAGRVLGLLTVYHREDLTRARGTSRPLPGVRLLHGGADLGGTSQAALSQRRRW